MKGVRNSLSISHPDLAAQWHPTKNGELTPDKVEANSSKRVWWYLPYDDPATGKHFVFEWESTVYNRAVLGADCPFLSGRSVYRGFNDLSTADPDTAALWHPTKNGDMTPYSVTAGSHAIVWWYLPYDDPVTGKHFDFEWQAAVKAMVRSPHKQGPFLEGKKAWKGFNDLSTLYPELSKEWNYEKNGTLTPENTTYGSNKSVWWKKTIINKETGETECYEWQEKIQSRIQKVGNRSIAVKRNEDMASFGSKYPELAAEWHPSKNGNLTPFDVTVSSTIPIWWLLPYDDPRTGKHYDFEWQDSVRDRVIRGRGCPYLSGAAVWVGFNDLASTYPKLAAEWHPSKNGDLTPFDVTAGSGKYAWWLLPYDDPQTGEHFDFEWKSLISSRTYSNAGCPYLSGAAIWIGFNDLGTTNPELSLEWDYDKNFPLTPQDVSAGSGQKVWWKRKEKDPISGKIRDISWLAEISDRAQYGAGPRRVLQQVVEGINDLSTTHPDLVKEWHPTRNGKRIPSQFKCTSNESVWWICQYHDIRTGKDFIFEWQDSISNRVNGRKCPYLTDDLLYDGFNDLATTHPTLAAQWHPTMNSITPHDVTAHSTRRIWWLMPYDDKKTQKHYDFVWSSTVYNRAILNAGCPYLTGASVWPGYNDLATTNPEVAKLWHPTKNGLLTPRDVVAGSLQYACWYMEYEDPKTGKKFNFEWVSRILTQCKMKNQCPYLSNLAVWPGYNDLESCYPEVAMEWYAERNHGIMPSSVYRHSGEKYWWRCKEGHVWYTTVYSRTVDGSNCPECEKRRRLKLLGKQ